MGEDEDAREWGWEDEDERGWEDEDEAEGMREGAHRGCEDARGCDDATRCEDERG